MGALVCRLKLDRSLSRRKEVKTGGDCRSPYPIV